MRAAYQGHADIVRLLVDHGANVKAKTRHGSTALNSASAGLVYEEEGKHAEVIRFLLEHGADASAYPEDSLTALMFAARKGDAGLVQILVEHGADVNAKDGLNRTALMWAVERAPSEVVQYLLEHGADPNVVMKKVGGTALDIAEGRKDPNIIKMLRDAGAKKWDPHGMEGSKSLKRK